MQEIYTNAGNIPVTDLCGWVGKNNPDLIAESLNVWSADPNKFAVKGLPYQAGSRTMLWEYARKVLNGVDTPNYPQEVGDCHIGSTMVNMADGGRKPISEIKVGDYVISVLGNKRKVLRTIHKKYSGPLYTLTAKGAIESITSTADHKFVLIPFSNHRWDHSSFDWREISKIEVKERILMPFGLNGESGEKLRLKNISDRCGLSATEIEVNPSFGRLYGLFLAEGSIKFHSRTNTPCGIRFSLGGHEDYLAEEIALLIQEIFNVKSTWKHRENKNVIILDCNNVNVGRFIHQISSGNVYTKALNDFAFRADKLTKLAILKGWSDGDACVTASSNLGKDMWRLALSCGLRPRWAQRKKEVHQRVASGRLNFYGNSALEIGIKSSSKIRRNLKDINQFGWANSVKSISCEYVDNVDVYCLEVEEDHSFIANGYASSNCVSFGSKNACEYVQFLPILNGARNKFTRVFPPYIYGCSRVFVGNGRLRGDGSLGSWAAQAVMKYGTIPIDAPNCPVYSGSIARKWGGRPGPPQEFVPIGQEHLIKNASPITTWEDSLAALGNGYPIIVSSDVGFDMNPRADGFNHYSTHWGHCMCFTQFTLITSLNSKYIKDIKVGDEVYGHDGKLHYVTDVYERPYDGELIVIRPWGHLPIELTPEHPVLVLRDSENDFDYINHGNIVIAGVKKIKQWVKASDIKLTDRLICPKTQFSNEPQIPQWIDKPFAKANKLFIDDDIAWFFGLYVADGGATKNHKITITLAIHQKDLIKRCIKVIKKLGFEASIKIYNNYIRVHLYSAVVADSFIEWFGKGKDKHLPDWIFAGWNLREVLNGIYDGDGNIPTGRPDGRRICNTSRVLIDQCRSILLYLGEKSSVSSHEFKCANHNTRYIIEWYPNAKPSQRINYWEDNDNLIIRIRKIGKRYYNGPVYNLEVEGCHSYIAEGVSVHNCAIGIDDDASDPYVCILNSWGDVFGRIKDFKTGEEWPIGTLRVRKKDYLTILDANDSFAFSSTDLFVAQPLPDSAFSLL